MNTKKSNWLILVVLLLPLILHCGARDPSPEKARIALHKATSFYTGTCGREDHASAKRLFLKAAKAGDPLAKMWVASLLRTGLGGFKRDSKRAKGMANEVIDEVRSLAGQGNVEAAYLLGNVYSRGRGITRDDTKGLSWLVKAAKAGHAASMDSLATIYNGGWLDDVLDSDKSFVWRRRAAEAGHANSMGRLA